MRSAIAGEGDAGGGAASATIGKHIRNRTKRVNLTTMAPDVVSFLESKCIMTFSSSVHR
jgi:hypothetical protein